MSQGSKFGSWFAEQFPHHAEARKRDLYEARKEAKSLEESAAMARRKVEEIEAANAAHDAALKGWNAKGTT